MESKSFNIFTLPILYCFVSSLFIISNCYDGRAELPQECVNAERQLNLKTKIDLYNKCIHSGKLTGYEYSIVYTKRGRIYEYLGENRLAIRDYDRALLTNPKYYEAYIKRGTIYYKIGKFEQSIEDFEIAIELRPNNKKAYNNLAWVLVTSKDPQYRNGERALELIQKAVELSAIDDINILDTLAAVYAELGQFDKAIEVQSKLIRISKERGDKELTDKFREILSDYEQKRSHY